MSNRQGEILFLTRRVKDLRLWLEEAEDRLSYLIKADLEEVAARKNTENYIWNTGGIVTRMILLFRGYRP